MVLVTAAVVIIGHWGKRHDELRGSNRRSNRSRRVSRHRHDTDPIGRSAQGAPRPRVLHGGPAAALAGCTRLCESASNTSSVRPSAAAARSTTFASLRNNTTCIWSADIRAAEGDGGSINGWCFGAPGGRPLAGDRRGHAGRVSERCGAHLHPDQSELTGIIISASTECFPTSGSASFSRSPRPDARRPEWRLP